MKLYKLNIRGNILNVINSFLFNRKVKLIINKYQGSARCCGSYGVPQGSVLSPLLFIIFISDMFHLAQHTPACKEYTSIYKYADDGSIAITHEDPIECHKIAQQMCDNLSHWCNMWRLKVNCDTNKTECLVIKPPSKKQTCDYSFPNLKINGKEIKYVQSTTVLGVTIDDKLTFQQHSNRKIQQCWFTWYNITKNSTRYKGLNVSSLVILFRSVVLTKLLYAAPVWLKHNLHRFRNFFARVCLKISGATHYPSQSLTLLAMGLEPLSVHYDIVATKFVLKALNSDTNMRSMMLQIEGSRHHPFYHHIVLARRYLQSKDGTILHRRPRQHTSLGEIDNSLTQYSKDGIEEFKMILWKEFLTSEADGKLVDLFTLSSFSIPKLQVRNRKFLFPRTSKRETDTKVMDLLHGHSLSFSSFKHSVRCNINPNCESCEPGVKDDNLHQLLDCPRYNSSYREPLRELSGSPNTCLSIVLEASKQQVTCFRNMAQIIVKL